MGGGNPFGGSSGIDSLLGSGSSKDESKESSFNVDELIQKIDAKIAMMEEEEEEEEKNSEEKEKTEKVIDAEIEEENKTKDSSMYENGTNSDEFFDDFFSDI